jgi:dolichol-phosphate mannosyltransferase
MKEQSKTQRYLVITPTYNEKANIRQLIPAVLSQHPAIDILFIDDNSPDGTAKLIKAAMKKNDRVYLIERERKLGLGTAYVRGFQYAVEQKYAMVFEMDADFSHNPAYLPEMIRILKSKADVVIGSRYIHGVSVAHWPIKRLILSKAANVYASITTGVKIKDLTAGFVGYRKKVLESINYSYIRSSGYAFQIEMKYRCHLWKFSMFELPIIFTDRVKGESKISRGIIFEAILRCITLRFSKKPRLSRGD